MVPAEDPPQLMFISRACTTIRKGRNIPDHTGCTALTCECDCHGLTGGIPNPPRQVRHPKRTFVDQFPTSREIEKCPIKLDRHRSRTGKNK